jgi:hypothetical protein
VTKVTVEYLAGPACGRRRDMSVGPSGMPPFWVGVTIPAVWDSALDDQPAVPETTHRYRRGERRTTPQGRVWSYHWQGPTLAR